MVALSYLPNPTYTRIYREHHPDADLQCKRCTFTVKECTGWKIKIQNQERMLHTCDTIHVSESCSFIRGTGSLVLEVREHK